MDKIRDTEYASGEVSSDIFRKAADAVVAGIAATADQYINMDKDTINPNSNEKSLYGDDTASQGSMRSGARQADD